MSVVMVARLAPPSLPVLTGCDLGDDGCEVLCDAVEANPIVELLAITSMLWCLSCVCCP